MLGVKSYLDERNEASLQEEIYECSKLLMLDVRNDEDEEKREINICIELLLQDIGKDEATHCVVPLREEKTIMIEPQADGVGGRKRKRKITILQDIQILPPKRKTETETIVIIDSDDDDDDDIIYV